MSKVSTTILAVLFSLSMAFANGKNEYFSANFFANANNDTNFVLIGEIESPNRTMFANINLVNNTVDTFQLDIKNVPDIFDVLMNKNSKSTYIFTNSKKVFIYKFGENTPNKVLAIDNNSRIYGLSNDGSLIYSYDDILDFVSIFDATNGERLDRFFVKSLKTIQNDGFFNSDKNEFAQIQYDSLYIWSIEQKKLIRTIYVVPNATNFRYIDDGNKLAYTVKNEVIIENINDGEIIFRKSFFDSEINSLQFSANMNYLIVNERGMSQTVYDMVNDKLLLDANNYIGNQYDYLPYLYVNNNYTKAIGVETFSLYCNRDGQDVIYGSANSIVNIDDNSKIASVPNGFVPNPTNAIISKDNNFLIVSGSNLNKIKTNVLIDRDENFYKYINVNDYPVTFLEDNNKIAFMEDRKFRVYNINESKFEREFDTQITDFDKVYFYSEGAGRIAITNKDEIKVFDYSNFDLLYTINYSNLGLEPNKIAFDNQSKISIFSYSKVYQLDVYSGVTEEQIVSNIDPNLMFVDITNDGRFILYRTAQNEFVVYDNVKNSIKYKATPGVVESYLKYLNAGFMGNHEIMWISYEPNPMDSNPHTATYDFMLDKTVKLLGDNLPIISDNGKLYYSYYCPLEYEINKIRDPQTSVEINQYVSGNIFPNPASDIIELNTELGENIKTVTIYDTFGKAVKVIPNYIQNDKIQISDLKAGVYFIKYDNIVSKFIKY